MCLRISKVYNSEIYYIQIVHISIVFFELHSIAMACVLWGIIGLCWLGTVYFFIVITYASLKYHKDIRSKQEGQLL